MITFSDFEWDEAKRHANVEKHGIDFVDVRTVFEDADLLVVRSQQAHAEDRALATGTDGRRLVTIVYTIRGDRLRLISARRARDKERELYERQRNDRQVRR